MSRLRLLGVAAQSPGRCCRTGWNPRAEFNAENMSWQKRSPIKKQAERMPDQAARQAVERLRTLVSPLLCRVPINEQKRTDMLAILEEIQKERSAEVINVLYEICAEIIFGCLSLGIDEVIEARLAQRRN